MHFSMKSENECVTVDVTSVANFLYQHITLIKKKPFKLMNNLLHFFICRICCNDVSVSLLGHIIEFYCNILHSVEFGQCWMFLKPKTEISEIYLFIVKDTANKEIKYIKHIYIDK